MSQSTHDLIGRIINPAPRSEAPLPAARTPAESVETLIGRIIHPYGPPYPHAEIVQPVKPAQPIVILP